MSENEGWSQQGSAVAQLRSIRERSGELPDNVTVLPGAGASEHLRILEAVLFAASEPLDEASLSARLPEEADITELLAELEAFYARRGVNLIRVAGKWTFRTAEDLAFLMRREAVETKRLSRAALETLAIIAYHQPTTRAEIEEVRGVAVNKGTLDVLMEAGWIRIKSRRQTPGRPVTFGTTDEFLSHFGLESVKDLPGVDELKAAGLLRADPPEGFEPDEPVSDDAESDDEEIDYDEIGEFEPDLADELADDVECDEPGLSDEEDED